MPACHALQDFLHQLWTLHRDEFHRRFGVAGLEDFWNQVREDDPRLQEHPLLHKEDYKQKCLPGRLHGDKVPYGKRKGASAHVSSWSIMTAVGTVWRTLHAWMVVPEGAKYKGLLCIAQRPAQGNVCARRNSIHEDLRKATPV